MLRHQATSNMTEKNLPKLVKYIFPTSEEWTGVWSLRYRELPFTSISIMNVGVAVNLYTVITESYTQPTKLTKVLLVISTSGAFEKLPNSEY